MQSGFSLVTAIFLLVILASLGAFIVTVSGLQQTSSALDVQGSRAYQAARSGIEWGTYQVQAAGTVAFDAAASTSAASASSLSWTHTASGSNRLVIVGATWGDFVTITSVTYGGTPMNFLGTQAQSDQNIAMYRLVAPPTGAQTVSVNFSGPSRSIAGSVSFTNVDQTTPTGTFASAVGFSTTPSVTVASAAGEMVIDTLDYDTGGTTVTPGAGQTQRWNLKPNINGAGSTEAGAASVTMNWTATGGADNWAIGAVSVKGGPGTFATACNPGPTTQTLTGMGGTLSGFTTTVDCSSSTQVEGGVTVQVYQLTSTATQGTVSTIDRVERQLQATVAR